MNSYINNQFEQKYQQFFSIKIQTVKVKRNVNNQFEQKSQQKFWKEMPTTILTKYNQKKILNKNKNNQFEQKND